MKEYIKPQAEIINCDPADMLAESLIIDNKQTVDGEDALIKEGNDWEIWD